VVTYKAGLAAGFTDPIVVFGQGGVGAIRDTVLSQISGFEPAAIRKLSDKPIQFIVNTSFHADRTGGNVKLQASGYDPSLVGSFSSNQFADAGQGATVIGHQNVQNRMIASGAAIPAAARPTDTKPPG
jgi:glyoxylase-like metal-dependent hydrolase (beta-lactamase superfamily II)